MASTDASLFSYEAQDSKKDKSPAALRTISEAAEIIDVPQHVLRFWETKFNQIKPLKRNGGRRFYRPQDLDVLQQIKHLLYNQGYTIKGAKKAVDDFIEARNSGAVASSSDWLEKMPAANVNDNHMPASPAPDLLAELAIALSAPEVTEDFSSRDARPFPEDELRVLRAQLVEARAALDKHLRKAA